MRIERVKQNIKVVETAHNSLWVQLVKYNRFPIFKMKMFV